MPSLNVRLPIRIGIIGITGYAGTHLRILQTHHKAGEVQLLAATVINRPEAEAACTELEALGCRIFKDYREMLDAVGAELDLCVIPSGIATHAVMTIDALRAGCHVLVEKPAAATVQQVDAMIEAQARQGKNVIVGFHDLCQPQLIAAKQAIISGALGKLTGLHIWGAWPRDTSYYNRNRWAGRVQSDGEWVMDSPANNALAHYLMAGLYLAGTSLDAVALPAEVTAELYRAQNIESFDTMRATIETSSGVPLHYGVSHSCKEFHNAMVEVTGEQGRIRWEVNRQFTYETQGRVETEAAPQGEELCQIMYREILKALGERRTVGCSLGMARSHTLLINGLHEFVPIHEIPHSFVDRSGAADNPQLSIRGVVEILRESVASGRSFREMGAPWATEPRRFSLRGYKAFGGPLAVH